MFAIKTTAPAGEYFFVSSDLRNPTLMRAKVEYAGPRKGYTYRLPDGTMKYPTQIAAETAAIAVEHYAHAPMRVVQVA